jgi:uncharacterized membrane protein YccC
MHALRAWRTEVFGTRGAEAAIPAILFGLRLWASVCLALFVAFELELDNAYWAGASAAIVCQPHLGASLRKGWFRMIGTCIGAVMIVVLTACFAQNRIAFLGGLALWGGACALMATLLHNFASYSAALSGYTAAVIAGDELGATGGAHGLAFTLAVTRASEICIGIVCAGVVLATTDLGNARRRLAVLLGWVSAAISGEFASAIALGEESLAETQPVRRELIRQVIALDPVIDEALGESAILRYHSPLLQTAVDGLFAALASWRTVSVCFARLPGDEASRQAGIILRELPPELAHGLGTHLKANPMRLHRHCEATAEQLRRLPAATPSLRLLADQVAEALAGLADALGGLALLVADPSRAPQPRRGFRLRVPDWLPALINAGRAFLTISAAALFWIVTEWPNGAQAITFAAIGSILFAPRADQAYASTVDFIVGVGITAVVAAVIDFAALPEITTFAGFCVVMGLFHVPAGTLLALPLRPTLFTPVVSFFLPLADPANSMNYDPGQFYKSVIGIVAGCGMAAMSFRLIPPLPPALRTRRLLMLTLRDLRRLMLARIPSAPNVWTSRVYGRLAVMPDAAEPLQRAELMAALTVGAQAIDLRRACTQLGPWPELDSALTAVAQGSGATAIAHLDSLDRRLAQQSDDAIDGADILRARAYILAISQALAQHAAYFDANFSR